MTDRCRLIGVEFTVGDTAAVEPGHLLSGVLVGPPWRYRERKRGPVPPFGGNSDIQASAIY